MPDPSKLAVFKESFLVPGSVIDENGHVNNVAYVQWMQELAVKHWRVLGGNKIEGTLGCTWVVRFHKVEYLSPAFEGDPVEAQTWVANIGKVRSLRKYAFIRSSDQKLLVRGETDWVFVRVETGKPHLIPASVRESLPIMDEGPGGIS